MKLEIIRREISSPSWLSELTAKYRRDQKELRKTEKEKKQKEVESLAEKIVKKLNLSKQNPKVTTTEVATPSEPKSESQKQVVKEIVELIRQLDEKYEKIIEDLEDRIDEVSRTQTKKQNGRVPVTHREPSALDLEIVQMRATELGLCGEIRKVIRDPYIQGRFSG